MTWAPGDQLQKGKYTIREVLGMGRIGVTYHAERPDGTPIVIKTINDEARLSPDFERFQQLFVKEAFKLSKCNHPHIVEVYEPFQEDGLWCIPMEYIFGKTLDKRNLKILPEAEALRYIHQIGDAFTVVHQNKLLHRDVRPENIMLRFRNGQSEAVLIDFGLARDFDHPLTRTRTDEIAAGFAPLELYSRNQGLGAYTDIYSLGATLYALLTGTIPPSADTRKLTGTPLLLPDSISQPTKDAIRWAMQLKAGDRPQTMQDWLKTLPQKGKTTIQKSTKHSGDRPSGGRFFSNLETWHMVIMAIAAIVTAIGALLAGLQGPAALMEVFKDNPPLSPTETQNPSRPQSPLNQSP